jgi:hypothetical protein
MGMFKSPEKPAPLDVAATADAAAAQNLKTAQTTANLSRPDQTDAAGNTIKYSQTGVDANGIPTYGVTSSLGALGQTFQSGLANLGQRYMATAGSGVPDSSAAFDKAYDLATANLEPRFQRASDAKYTQLRNQGLDPTSEAFKSASNDLALQQNEARNSLVSSLQGQMFNQGLQSRQQELSELSPGLTYGASTTSPSAVSVPGVSVSTVDVAGLTAQSNADQWKGYQADVQRQGAMLGGLASIAGSVLAAPMTGGTSLFGTALGGLGALGRTAEKPSYWNQAQ